MLKVGRNFFGNSMDADDVAQEGLLRLWKYCERLNAQQDIDALAVKVAKNVCVDMWKGMRRTSDAPPDEDIAEASDRTDSTLIVADTQEEIGNAINQLKPRERQLFVARQMEDKTVDEIADDTGIPKPSVQSMLSMAKKKFLKELKRRLEL